MFSIGRLSLVQLIRMSAGLITEGVLDTDEGKADKGVSWFVTWRLSCHRNIWKQDEVILVSA